MRSRRCSSRARPLPARALARLEAALSGLAGARVELERPGKPEHGDYATNAALQLAPAQRRPPRELAQELADKAAALPEVERAEIAGPGFVNLWLAQGWYGDALADVLDAGDAFGGGQAEPLERVDSYEKDGAVWARSSTYGDEQDRVVTRSNGTPTYRAADIAYLEDKLSRGFDRAIYVLGADHHGTRNWYAAVARMLGHDPDRVEVLLYQLVHLTTGGQQTKMSKRRGDVVFLDELVDEIGVDAARWYLVNRGPDQTIEIDVDLAAERTQKHPVYYVQYAHARIAGILRNAPQDPDHDLPPSQPLAAEERDLIKRLLEFPRVAAEALVKRGPQGVPAY